LHLDAAAVAFLLDTVPDPVEGVVEHGLHLRASAPAPDAVPTASDVESLPLSSATAHADTTAVAAVAAVQLAAELTETQTPAVASRTGLTTQPKVDSRSAAVPAAYPAPATASASSGQPQQQQQQQQQRRPPRPLFAPSTDPSERVGSEVMRVYRYLRAPGGPPPGIAGAATALHCDMGLLTVSPASTLPELALLHPSGSRWLDVEVGAQAGHYYAFVGECLPRLVALARKSAAEGGLAEGSALRAAPLHPGCCAACDREAEAAACAAASAAAPEARDASGGGGGIQRGRRALRAPLHFVDERHVGFPRFSFPFFLRARPTAELRPGLTFGEFVHDTVLEVRAPTRPPSIRPPFLTPFHATSSPPPLLQHRPWVVQPQRQQEHAMRMRAAQAATSGGAPASQQLEPPRRPLPRRTDF
jgi:hypothetical protein